MTPEHDSVSWHDIYIVAGLCEPPQLSLLEWLASQLAVPRGAPLCTRAGPVWGPQRTALSARLRRCGTPCPRQPRADLTSRHPPCCGEDPPRRYRPLMSLPDSGSTRPGLLPLTVELCGI